ncbi:hypothetical protein ABK040_011442 [Willaertia magna]
MEQQQKEQSSSVPTTSNNNTTVEEQQQDTTQTTTIPVVNNNEENVEETTTTKPLTEEELKEAIRKQIEYYFSNLSTNHYLVSQMSHDLYVPLQTIANFKMIKALTNGDLNLIINAIKSSTVIQLDEEEKRMKPININLPNKRTTVIIRNIPNTVEKEKILSLFETNNLPSNVYAEIGDTWFCSFSEEEQAMNALNHLRNNCSWNDKPIQARIKSENILKSVNNNVSNTSTTNISGGNVTGSMNNHTNNNNGNHNYQNNNQQGGYQKRYNNYRNNRYVKNNTSPNTNDNNNNQQQQHRRRTNRSNSGANNNTTNVTSSSSSPSTTNTTTTTTNNQQQVNVGNNNNRKSHHGHSHYNKHYQHHNQHYRKEQINLSSVKSFPPLPKLNETTESGGMVGYPITHKFLRYSKQTVIKVYMKQQKEGEHANFPTDLITLNSAKCLAILNEPKSELELRKPQMEKSKIANLTIAPEGGNATTTGVSGNDEGTATSSLSIQTTNVGTGTTTVGSKKPLNLIIPPKSPTEFSKSFAEAAITAKDIKTPDLPSSSGFFAKQRKRRTGSINKNDSHHGTVGSSSGHHHHHHHSKGNNENKRDNTSSTTRGKKHHSGGLKKSTTGVHYHKQERNNENAISLSNVDMLKTNNENDKEQQQENNESNNEEQKQSWVSVVASTKK